MLYLHAGTCQIPYVAVQPVLHIGTTLARRHVVLSMAKARGEQNAGHQVCTSACADKGKESWEIGKEIKCE